MTARADGLTLCNSLSASSAPCTRLGRIDGYCWQHVPRQLAPPVLHSSGAAVVTTRCGTPFLIDVDDYESVATHRWTLDRGGYPRRWLLLEGRRPRSISIQRHILGLPIGDPRHADHINGDVLDNRRSNLRAVSRSENAQNVRAVRGYRGVRRHRGRWQASATVYGVVHHIGTYETEQEAAHEAHMWRLRHMPGYVDRPAARESA